MVDQVRVLTLNEREDKKTVLYRLEKGWILQFALGPSLQALQVRVFSNHPITADAKFDSQVFREIPWHNLTGMKSDTYDSYAEVKIVKAGSFRYFFTVDGSESIMNSNGSGFFLVDPVLRVGAENEALPLDCIQCQTFLAKQLGALDQWEARLKVSKESGYNMVHFTPIQELGESNSAYSLKNQLKLNPIFSPGKTKYGFSDLGKLVEHMRKDWKVASITDLVYNHTASNSDWLLDHPESSFNVVNSPHLRPAFVMDRILWHFNLEVAAGKWTDRGIPVELSQEQHLTTIQHVLMNEILPKHRLHEYYLMHIDNVMAEFRKAVVKGRDAGNVEGDVLELHQDLKYRRLYSTIDINLALKLYNVGQGSGEDEAARVERCCENLRHRLDELNAIKYDEMQSHMRQASANYIANARYRFLEGGGPRLGKVTRQNCMMEQYFSHPAGCESTVEEEEKLMDTPSKGQLMMAHNGWVMNDDPLRNFAERGSNIYIRRELIVWGDSVKLRFGKSREDCPYLWDHMLKYTLETVKIFQGVRLDNCHSTPIHVAEYLLTEARKIRPDLYVIAELFTSDERMDNIFINRLGINSLIREAMSAWDSHEQGRLVYRYGGVPVGAFMQPQVRPLTPCIAHAIFVDQTHDNPSPVQKRSVYDLLPSSALVSMGFCATGSNRGYDEIVPHHIHVVAEKRLYQSWSEKEAGAGLVNMKSGIIAGKRALNALHYEMGQAGFNQVYVDQVNSDVVAVTRHNPVNHQSIILVARTAFSMPTSMNTGYLPPLCVPGLIEEIILEARLEHKGDMTDKENKERWGKVEEIIMEMRLIQKGDIPYSKNDKYINGMPDYHVCVREHLQVNESDMVEMSDRSCATQELDFINFPPGSVIAIRVSLSANAKTAITKIREALTQFGYRMRTTSGQKMDPSQPNQDFRSIVSRLSFSDFNRVLFRSDPEEQSDGKNFGAYSIPNFGAPPYCGLQGFMSLLSKIRPSNDLGHPMCSNLRDGDWMPDYIANRLKVHDGTKDLGQWFSCVFGELSKVPRYMIPCYFDALMTGAYVILEEAAWATMSKFVREGSSFVRALAMGGLQFCGVCNTCQLPPLSPTLAAPAPPTTLDEKTGKKVQSCLSISAGFPHFAAGLFRSWGRDTFIALPGLLLLTGRFQEARFIILAYAGTLRHGLLPNLLGSGIVARYNCRDAVWFWLQCIQEYVQMAPDGAKILKDRVSRMYPTDDVDPQPAGKKEEYLYDTIQEAMQRHADGVKFRERNAGKQIDNDMSDEGFNNEIGVDWETGFPFGGNKHNCGTWMDKMGGSDKAGNLGTPATPRDGSAVELVGLCKSAVRWLAESNKAGIYPYAGVETTVDGKKVKVTYEQWGKKIVMNFEKYFWIGPTVSPSEANPKLVNQKGIYKDSHGAQQPWTDYQLRCNFPIALAVAPELCTPSKAWKALSTAQEKLLGPLGIKTLDDSDWNYDGNYVNSDDSCEHKRAKGFNYHQGPEWVWPVGYFLQAKLHFAKLLDKQQPGTLKKAVSFVRGTLSHHQQALLSSDWRSLPELTNKDGAVCHDSCPAQAWSMSCILAVLHKLEQLH